MVSNGVVANPDEPPGTDWVRLYLIGLLLVAFLLAVGAVGQARESDGARAPRGASPTPAAPVVPAPPTSAPTTAPTTAPTAAPTAGPDPSTSAEPSPQPSRSADGAAVLPDGGTRVFAQNKFLVAYYGSAGSGALGVLGEKSPDAIYPQLVRASRPFARNGRSVQPVFELIVTVAHAGPTRSGMYSSDIARAEVQRYIDAAHRHGVLLLLDLQPGRANFLAVAKRWEWALKDPYVGLALDPEWRMGRTQVPGRVIGSVSADEVNQVTRWLDTLTEREGLPQKVFVLHQFRTSMIRGIERVVGRPNLAMVQHVDGFGPPTAKLATYRTVAKPRQFVMGFKLFYDEDVPRMTPAQVLRIRPQVRFVSFQ